MVSLNLQNKFRLSLTKEEIILKKKIIICILIVALLALAIVVNLRAMQMKEDNKNSSTTMKQDVEKENGKDEATDRNVDNRIEELELIGDKYKPEETMDKDGNTVSNELEEGRPMITLYWNTKEDSSKEALKILQIFYSQSKYVEKINFSAVAVVENFEEEKSEIENFIAENNIEVPVVYKTATNSEGMENDIANIPTLLVVNKKGEVINNMMNNITADSIEANLDIISENY